MGELPFPAWDPVIVHLGPLQIRWYSLAYVAAFVVASVVLTRLARARVFPLPPVRVQDLIFWLVVGVILGGRVGYVLFYRPELLTSPSVFAIWEGGLSFHGGLLGVIVCAVVFSLRNGVSPWRTLDCLAIATPPGVFFVRCANFINGELYGRICDPTAPLDPERAPPWAMRFPTDPVALRALQIPPGGGIRAREEAVQAAFADGRWEAVKETVPLRHPSQLYEALGEGVLLGLVLLCVYLATRRRPLGSGVYGGLFVLGYGVVRFFIEYFREPDEQFKENGGDGTVLAGMTMGQVLCAAMIVAGLTIIALRWSHRQGLRVDEPPTEAGNG